MKPIVIIFVFGVTMLSNPDYCFSQRTWLSPGVKLGYTFGEKGGFTWGVEVSLTFEQEVRGGTNYYGFVVSMDRCRDLWKIYLGVQGSIATRTFFPVGLSAGPTLISENGDLDFGIGLIPFAGFILYPYYHFTYRLSRRSLHEIGGYLKIPIRIIGRDPFRF